MIEADDLIDEIHPWIHMDVTRDDVKSVLWAIANSGCIEEVNEYVEKQNKSRNEMMERA